MYFFFFSFGTERIKVYIHIFKRLIVVNLAKSNCGVSKCLNLVKYLKKR